MLDHQALILIDLQNDFCSGGALAVPFGEAVIPVANRLQKHFKRIIATQDWHPAHHGSFASSYPGKNLGECIDLHGVEQILWPDHCVHYTHGAAFHPDLEIKHFSRVFQKGVDPNIDSYSAFYDNDHRHQTGLTDYLKQCGITDIYLMGLATDYCVKWSALDAVLDGFNVFLIEDGCRGIGLHNGDIDASIREMRDHGVNIIHANDIE